MGYDARFLAEQFAALVADVLGANGIPVYVPDRDTPTPVVAYTIKARNLAGAVMLTASHNPPEYNGIKFIPDYCHPALPDVTDAITKRIGELQADPSQVKTGGPKPTAIDPKPARLSRRWIQNALREELRFEGAVFTDDLSMGGAAEYGDIVARATAALEAGCDVLPVCNDRASVTKLLDELDFEVEPAAHLRLVRMRGRPAPERDELYAGDAWRSNLDLLARSSAAPKLNLTAGNA